MVSQAWLVLALIEAKSGNWILSQKIEPCPPFLSRHSKSVNLFTISSDTIFIKHQFMWQGTEGGHALFYI